MPLTPDMINTAVERYWREMDRYSKLAEFFGDTCQRLLDTNVIRGSVQWRAKNPERLKAKLLKQMETNAHSDEYTDADSIFQVIKDLAGVRILTYIETDRPRVVDLLRQECRGFEANDAVGARVMEDEPPTGTRPNLYRATHCLVRLKDPELVGRYQNLKDLMCEIQVCSLLAHVYNEIEHDLRYKPLTGVLSDAENELLDSLGSLTHTGDTIIKQTLAASRRRHEQNVEAFEDAYDFVARMRTLFPAADFPKNAGQLYEVCVALGLDSPEKIRTALRNFGDLSTAGSTLAERVAAHTATWSDTQMKIDPQSSDQLLVLVLRDASRLERLRTLYPCGRGIGRAPRFLSVAKQVEDLQD